MEQVKIIFNDNSEHFYAKDTSFYEISKDYQTDNPILGVKINNEVYPLAKKVTSEATVTFFDVDDLIGNKMYKSALKFIFEVALSHYDDSLKVTFDHSVPKGMLGTIDSEKILTQIDIDNIKTEMEKIVAEDLIIEKLIVQPNEAIKYYLKVKQYEKADNIQNINDRAVTLYKLNNHLNYFYSEMPYSTGAINKFNLVYLGNNKIVFLFHP